MRILLAVALAISACASSIAAADPPDRDRFSVPRASRTPADEPTTHEVILPADIIALPGETPSEALARALHSDDETTVSRADEPVAKQRDGERRVSKERRR